MNQHEDETNLPEPTERETYEGPMQAMSPTGAVAMDESPLQREVRRVELALADLEESARLLEAKLDPILTPLPEEAPESEPMNLVAPARDPESAHVRALGSYANHVNFMVGRIRYLTSRIEL